MQARPTAGQWADRFAARYLDPVTPNGNRELIGRTLSNCWRDRMREGFRGSYPSDEGG
jgi:hypothetical protein